MRTRSTARWKTDCCPRARNFITPEKLARWDVDTAIEKITKATEKAYEEKIDQVKEELGIDYADVERRFLLMNVDRNWIDQIDAMDQLRKGIGLRAYGNVGPRHCLQAGRL